MFFKQADTPQDVVVSTIAGKSGIVVNKQTQFGATDGCDGGIIYNLVFPVNKKITYKEHLFQLNPSEVGFIPGKTFESSLHIPEDVKSWKVRIMYDSLLVKFDTILNISNLINISYVNELRAGIQLYGTGENGDILIRYKAYLPHNSDSTFPMTIIVDSLEAKPCETAVTRNNSLILGSYCAKSIRSVNGTGKNYYLRNKSNQIEFGVGLSGNVRLEIFDYTGTLKQVLSNTTLQAGEYSVDLDLPTGIYFCKINSGMYFDIIKVVTTN